MSVKNFKNHLKHHEKKKVDDSVIVAAKKDIKVINE
jgi:hypothetical protein